MIKKAINYVLITPILLTMLFIFIIGIFSGDLDVISKIILCLITIISLISNYIMVYLAIEYERFSYVNKVDKR